MLGWHESGYSLTLLIVSLSLRADKTWIQQSLLLKALWESRYCSPGSVPALEAVMLYSWCSSCINKHPAGHKALYAWHGCSKGTLPAQRERRGFQTQICVCNGQGTLTWSYI